MDSVKIDTMLTRILNAHKFLTIVLKFLAMEFVLNVYQDLYYQMESAIDRYRTVFRTTLLRTYAGNVSTGITWSMESVIDLVKIA